MVEGLKKNVIVTFLKAQFSSIISTLVDFAITYLFTQVAPIKYLISSIIGTMAGGSINFLLGRNWVFNKRNNIKFNQTKRYVLVWIGSLLLNTNGVYLLTNVLKLHYLISKSIITVIIGIFFNFYLQKTFVFRA